MRFALALGIVLTGFILSGDLRSDGPSEILNFAEVAARHFHALKVERATGAPSEEPLVFRVTPIGDAKDEDLGPASRWLLENWNVRLVTGANGMPLYLTERDLVGSAGNDALGATVPAGMAVETRDGTLVGCAIAHEVGHALGLKHAHDRADIMGPRCDHGKLAWAETSEADAAKVARLHRITAANLLGTEVWAERTG